MDTSNLRQRFQNNETEVFEQLYRYCFPKVAYMVKALGGNQLEAEDIFQDSLIILYEKIVHKNVVLRSNAEAYLMGIAKNLWVRSKRANSDHLTFSQSEKQIEIPTAFYTTPAPAKLNIFRLLSVAGKKCMDLLQAFYYQQLSANQLAEDFGFSSARSATAQKYKCLEKIREQVKQKQLSYEEVVE